MSCGGSTPATRETLARACALAPDTRLVCDDGDKGALLPLAVRAAVSRRHAQRLLQLLLPLLAEPLSGHRLGGESTNENCTGSRAAWARGSMRALHHT